MQRSNAAASNHASALNGVTVCSPHLKSLQENMETSRGKDLTAIFWNSVY